VAEGATPPPGGRVESGQGTAPDGLSSGDGSGSAGTEVDAETGTVVSTESGTEVDAETGTELGAGADSGSGTGSRADGAAGAGRTPQRQAPPARWRRVSRSVVAWARTPDGVSVAVLVVLPLLLFVIPAMAGHPAITGDNLIQNFPLRALTGLQMRQGHLPLWDPYIWSGSPLLGGLNAGSFYPFTFVFAVLPAVGAWVVNLLGVYWAGGLGMYALARQYRLRPLASLLGALTYAFGGAMSGQIVHLGVIEGMGWMPLLVLALLRLSWAVLGTGPVKASLGAGGDVAEAMPATLAWRWVVLLAAVIGLEALTGEPRAMAETEIVGPLVVLWLVLRPYGGRVPLRRRAAMVALAVAGGAWGALLAGAELVPGWSFIEASQRAVEGYWFFGSGSLRPSWSALMFVPDLFGGAGLFGQTRYFNNYNLTEVTGYVGLLPVAAALVLVSRSFGRRRSRLAADWGMWLAMAALGLLLSWGSFTPLGHLFHLIPLFGKTRLQSRNLEIVDFALAVLLAFWADRLLGRRGTAATGTDGWRRWLAVAPAVAAVGLCVAALAIPARLEESLGTTAAGGALARSLWPWFAAEVAVAVAVAGLVLGWRRLSPRARRRAVTAVVVADLVLFTLATSTVVAPARATLEPTPAAAAAVLGTAGRFAIYDTSSANVDTASQVGQPDLNLFTELPSVQGYGSILSETYGTATGTHTLDTLDPCALERGDFSALRLSTLLAIPSSLAPGVAADGAVTPPPAACPGVATPGTAHRRTMYFGWSLALRGATLVRVAHVEATGTLRVGVVGRTGAVRWPAETLRRTKTGWSLRFRRSQVAAGLVLEGPVRAVSDTSTITGTEIPSVTSASTSGAGAAAAPALSPPPPGRWSLDGVLQDALDTTAWRFAGSWNMYGVFVRTSVRPPVWLSAAVAGSHVSQVRTTDWGSATDDVVATRPVTVVWSESYLSGWHATLVPAGGGPSRALHVERDGLVQSVRVPAGTWVLTFSYRPPGLTAGIAGSALALLAFAAAGAVVTVRRRRRRGREGPGPGSGSGPGPGPGAGTEPAGARW
jgi:hypothetical protein